MSLYLTKCFLQTGPDMLITGYLQPVPALYPSVSAAVELALADYLTPSTKPPAVITFYKTWDLYGAFSNFSPHPITVPDEDGNDVVWNSVEHYYQVIFLPFVALIPSLAIVEQLGLVLAE